MCVRVWGRHTHTDTCANLDRWQCVLVTFCGQTHTHTLRETLRSMLADGPRPRPRHADTRTRARPRAHAKRNYTQYTVDALRLRLRLRRLLGRFERAGRPSTCVRSGHAHDHTRTHTHTIYINIFPCNYIIIEPCMSVQSKSNTACI